MLQMLPLKRKRPNDQPPPRPPPPPPPPEGLDFISQLPDCVLSSILSFLPIRDSARTSILSSRWRHLWKAAPLRLDDSLLSPEKPHCSCRYHPMDWPRYAVSRILDCHIGPIDSLRLSRFPGAAFYPKVDCFVESAVQRGIGELTLEFDRYRPVEDSYQLLPSLLHSKSLHQLSLTGCRFPNPVLPSIFPNVKELRLDCVELNGELFRILLSNCDSLETLHLVSCVGLPVASVSSPRLRKFIWNSWIEELIIEYAPNLESFMLSECMEESCKVMVRHAPKLELLGFLSMELDALQLGETCFERQPQEVGYGQWQSILTIDVKARPYGMKTLSTVKTLAIKMDPHSCSSMTIPSLLRCFPYLENLDVQNFESIYCDGSLPKGFWDEQDSFNFLDHLRTVTVNGFCGDPSEVEFLKYLVAHGKVLKKMTLLCSMKIYNKFEKIKKPHVGIEKRASSDLQLILCINNLSSEHFSPWNKLIDEIDY